MSKKSRALERKLKRRYGRMTCQERQESYTPTEKPAEFGRTCVFCGSTDITRHHVVFQRFAPELASISSNIVPMCMRCQKLLHFYTDTLLDYLKTHGKLDHHEIRPPKPIYNSPTQPPKEVERTVQPITITGGQVTINF